MENVLIKNEVNKMELAKLKETQHKDKHLEMLRWINYHKQWEEDFKIICGDQWDRYKRDKDYEMYMICLESNEIYSEFYNMTGVHLINLDNFVGMSYIDEGNNDVEVVVNINGKQERFIIGV